MVALVRGLFVIVAFSAAMPQAAQAQANLETCPAERAIYQMRVDDSDQIWTLSLVPARNMASMASDLYLRLTTPQRDYWFSFNASQGYGGTSIMPITDPYVVPGPRSLVAENDIALGWLRFLGLNHDLAIADNAPNSGDVAPSYIILPEIGEGLWYSPSSFTEALDAVRDFMPRGVFKRTSCLVSPPPFALP